MQLAIQFKWRGQGLQLIPAQFMNLEQNILTLNCSALSEAKNQYCNDCSAPFQKVRFEGKLVKDLSFLKENKFKASNTTNNINFGLIPAQE